MVTETDRYTSTDYTIMRRRQGRVDIDETERSYLKSSYYNQIVYKAWRKRETLRRNSSDIIYENEYKETRKDSMTQTMDRIEDINNNNNQTIINKKKRSYMTRKHFSDDVVYVQIDDAFDSRSECDSSDSVENVNIRLNRPVSTVEDEQRLSRSDSNLNVPSEGIYSRKLVTNKNHLDITKTHMFKEIYADNLRQYSFLLAKQLGTSNRSPQQLRKSYMESRKRAIERRERSLTNDSIFSRKSSSDEDRSPRTSLSTEDRPRRGSSPVSTQSIKSNSASDLSTSKYAESLTDVSSIGSERDIMRKTVIHRRKHKKPLDFDPKKRLSAPNFDRNILLDIENEIAKQRNYSISSHAIAKSRSSSTCSLTVQDTSSMEEQSKLAPPSSAQSCMSYRNQSFDMQCESNGWFQYETQSWAEMGSPAFMKIRERRMSAETIRRQSEARERREFRMSRLKSFDDVLNQAGDLVKDYKRKMSQQNVDQNKTTKSCDNNNTEVHTATGTNTDVPEVKQISHPTQIEVLAQEG